MSAEQEYIQRIHAVWVRLDFEALIAPGDLITARHLAIATLAQPEVQEGLTSLALPTQNELRRALTGGGIEPSASTTDRVTLRALPPKSLTEAPDFVRSIEAAWAWSSDRGARCYFRLLRCAMNEEPQIAVRLETLGIDLERLQTRLDELLVE